MPNLSFLACLEVSEKIMGVVVVWVGSEYWGNLLILVPLSPGHAKIFNMA